MLNRQRRRSSVQCGAWLVLVLTIACPLLGRGRKDNQVDLKLAFSLGDDDLWRLHPWGAWLDSFDISPDGNTFAAEFEALQEAHEAAIWIGEWSIATGRLIAERSIEGPAPIDQLLPSPPNPAQYSWDLRFTPDGRKLVALDGPRVWVLQAEDLKELYSILPAGMHLASTEVVVLRQFVASGNSNQLAVFSARAIGPWETTSARLFNVDSGERVAQWVPPQPVSGEFSLSQDGNEVLMSQGGFHRAGAADVLLMDSRTGTVLRTFSSGFGSSQSRGGVYAEFLDKGHFAVACRPPAGASHHVLKVVDLSSGNVVQELGYSKHDANANVAIASRTPVIAALIFSWKRGIGSDLDYPLRRWVDWLALFRLGQPEPLYVRQSVRLFEGGNALSVAGIRNTIRISSEGKLLAFGEGRAIQVYRVTARAKPGESSR